MISPVPDASVSLAQAFLDALSDQASATGTEDLNQRLGLLVAEGQAAWPTIRVEPVAMVAFVARQIAPGEVGQQLEGLRPADLHLACACALRTPSAIEVFDKLLTREVDLALARMRVGPARTSDVKQLVRQRLFVGPDGGPGKILEYGGRGDLRRWVRAVAVRTCLNDLRKGRLEVSADEETLIAQHAIAGDDPEIDYMKRTYARQFQAAFAAALSQLPAREQTLLRYHHVDGLNIDEIGAIYRVHRVTAFRWLEKARSVLIDATLATLRAQLQLSARELDSVLRMIRSQVHLSLVRQLGGRNDRGDDPQPLDAADLEEIDP